MRLSLVSRSLFFAGGLASAFAYSGGDPQNVLLIVDPTNAESMYVANYYKQARGIPESNVVYMRPGAGSYQQFVDLNKPSVLGTLTNHRLLDTVGYLVITPGAPFLVPASGYVSDGCSPVNRFSISGAYTLIWVSDEILAQNLSSTWGNRFFGSSDDARAFDPALTYLGGVPDSSANARKYFIGAMLGYSGQRGNTVAETLAMIDRSVAADGTRPAGSFYFCRTGDQARSGPRHNTFPAVINAILARGGQAEQINDILPYGRHDCLGIMTGWADPGVEGADVTIRPGAIADHLTSWAATFDIGDQMKVSSWIRKGASGSWGTVEEPCNYAGKFPHARTHLWYFQGLSLGETLFRSVSFAPFQGLLYGDPLTRPFAYIPTVVLPDFPGGPVSGVLQFTVNASTGNPNGQIGTCELYVDGAFHSAMYNSGRFIVDSTGLADGVHEVRVLAFDNTLVRSVGHWRGQLVVNNQGRSATASVTPGSGNLATRFRVSVSSPGASHVRVVHNGRVLASASGSSADLFVTGLDLGAGPVSLRGEGLFANGARVQSAPLSVDVGFVTGSPSQQAPVAFSYTKRIVRTSPAVVELPTSFDERDVTLTWNVLTPPTQATLPGGQIGPHRVVVPLPNASGTDTMTFRVSSPYGDSQIGTVTLVYTDPFESLPIFYELVRGTYQSGRLDDLFFSDDSRLVVLQRTALAPTQPNVRVEFVGSSRTQAPRSLTFTLESSCSAIPSGNVERRIELYNFDLETWELVLTDNPTNADSVTRVTVDTDVSRFVDPGTRQVNARVSYFDRGAANIAWVARFDQAVFTIVR